MEIQKAEYAKCLGVIIDKKLFLRRILEDKCQKSLVTVWQFTGTSRIEWSRGPRQMAWTHTVSLFPGKHMPQSFSEAGEIEKQIATYSIEHKEDSSEES